MSTSDAGAPSGSGGNGGSGSGNSGGLDGASVVALVNETVNKANSPWVQRFNERIKALDEVIAKLSASSAERQPQEPTQPVAGNDASTEKLSLKALHEQIANLNKAIESERQARAKAEAGAKDARMRAEVERRLTAKLGADNPLVPTLMDSLYDVKKRFVETADGRLAVKFTDAGYDDFKPLDEGVEALFSNELKHLVQQSKAAALPPTPSNYRVAGQPIPQAPRGMTVNPILAEIAGGIAKDRPELTQQLMQMAIVPEPNK
jgi:hypothetical protein